MRERPQTKVTEFDLPRGRFKSFTLQKLSKLHDIKANNLLEQINLVDNKLDTIAGDYTKTDAQKILLSKEVYKKDSEKIFEELLKVLGTLKKEQKETEEQFNINILRAEPLTSEQMALLPLVKEQYLKNNKIPDNDGFQKSLVFLADNGLIDPNSLKAIEAKTPAELREKADSLNSVYTSIDSIGVDYAHMVEQYTNNPTIDKIEKHKYKE